MPFLLLSLPTEEDGSRKTTERAEEIEAEGDGKTIDRSGRDGSGRRFRKEKEEENKINIVKI